MLRIEDASSSMSVHRLNMLCWVEDEDQLGQGTAGEWTKQQGEGGVDDFVELFVSCVCFSGAAWLGLAWLACLPLLRWYMSVCGRVGWVGGGWRLRDGLCWATRRCTCQVVPWGHRTHQATILLEVFFLFM